MMLKQLERPVQSPPSDLRFFLMVGSAAGLLALSFYLGELFNEKYLTHETLKTVEGDLRAFRREQHEQYDLLSKVKKQLEKDGKGK